jgi:hypothetical protein
MVSIVSFGEPASRDCMLTPFTVRTDEMGINLIAADDGLLPFSKFGVSCPSTYVSVPVAAECHRYAAQPSAHERSM